MLRFTVTGQRLERKDEDLVVANAANFPQISVSFVNSPWNTSNTLGIFTNGDDTYKAGFINSVITVPYEVLTKSGVLYFSLVYKDPIGVTQVTTNRVGIKVEASGSIDGIEPDQAEISTDNIDQIYINADNIDKLDDRVTELENASIPGDMTKSVYDPNGRNTDIFKYTDDKISDVCSDNAGAHNSIYRGKYLGASVTTAQYTAIANGSFTDLYIGDYWTIGGYDWRIAAFDYYFNTGDTACLTHHVVIVPDKSLGSAMMNSSGATTVGGYVGSEMYTANLATFKTKIATCFNAAHLLTHRQYFSKEVNASTGLVSSCGSYDSTVNLMSEHNVYGGSFYIPTTTGTVLPVVNSIDNSQYPLFRYRPDMIVNRNSYWLRDVVSAYRFSCINYIGISFSSGSNINCGVRPYFCLKG